MSPERCWRIGVHAGPSLSGDVYDLYQVCADAGEVGTYECEVRALWEALAESALEEVALIVGQGPFDAVAGLRRGSFQHPKM